MKKTTRKKIPINIISGPLGVGKTTTINHLLSLRPEKERWAVLVNEYGLVGLDAALMQSATSSKRSPGVEIKEVAGGCICCSAGFMFEVSLVLLLQRRPDRLLIEPTGLAALSGILDTLDRPGIREAVDVRSVLCLLDPARFEEALLREEVCDQVEAADVLLASRSDLATPDQLAHFRSWADQLFPPKRSVKQIVRGHIPLALLDLVVERTSAPQRAGHKHGTDHHHHHAHHDHHDVHDQSDAHDHDVADESAAETGHVSSTKPIVQHVHRSDVTSTFGWVCWEGLVFDAERISCWISALSKIPGSLRTKAVFRTNEGWWGFNFVDDIEEVHPSGYRRDSRLEVIIEGHMPPEANELDKALRDCLLSTD